MTPPRQITQRLARGRGARLLAALALLIVLPGCAAAVAHGQEGAPTLVVNDQSIPAGSTTVSIPLVTATEPFYIVLYEGNGAGFGLFLSSTPLMEPGTYRLLQLHLGRPPRPAEYVWAVLHGEASGNATFDGVLIDPPLTGANGNPRLDDAPLAFGFRVNTHAAPAPPDLGGGGLVGRQSGGGVGVALALAATLALLSAARATTAGSATGRRRASFRPARAATSGARRRSRGG